MIRGFALLGTIAGAMMCSYQAAALEQRMIGAWIQSAADCAATFERRGSEIRFRRPVDEFRTAFIVKANGITGDGLTTSSTQIIESINKDSLKLRSTDRVVGTELLPDIEETVMVRKPPPPSSDLPAPHSERKPTTGTSAQKSNQP